MPDNDKYILSSVDSALAVLNLFFDHEELSATEIASIMGVNRSSIFRFLVTLENRGYLTKDSHSRYRLGIKMFTLGQLAKSRMELNRLIHPFLEKLSEDTGETSHLIILEGYRAIFTDKSVGTSALKMDTPLGTMYMAHNTAGGKAILAFSEPEFLNAYSNDVEFMKLTPGSLASPEELAGTLSQIVKRGYAMDNEEAEIGLTCIAVPVFDERRQPICAISVSGPTSRILSGRKKIVELLTQTSTEITGILK